MPSSKELIERFITEARDYAYSSRMVIDMWEIKATEGYRREFILRAALKKATDYFLDENQYKSSERERMKLYEFKALLAPLNYEVVHAYTLNLMSARSNERQKSFTISLYKSDNNSYDVVVTNGLGVSKEINIDRTQRSRIRIIQSFPWKNNKNVENLKLTQAKQAESFKQAVISECDHATPVEYDIERIVKKISDGVLEMKQRWRWWPIEWTLGGNGIIYETFMGITHYKTLKVRKIIALQFRSDPNPEKKEFDKKIRNYLHVFQAYKEQKHEIERIRFQHALKEKRLNRHTKILRQEIEEAGWAAAGKNTLTPPASTSTPVPSASTSTPAPPASTSTPAPPASTSTPAPPASTSTPTPSAASTSTPTPPASTSTPAPPGSTRIKSSAMPISKKKRPSYPYKNISSSSAESGESHESGEYYMLSTEVGVNTGKSFTADGTQTRLVPQFLSGISSRMERSEIGKNLRKLAARYKKKLKITYEDDSSIILALPFQDARNAKNSTENKIFTEFAKCIVGIVKKKKVSFALESTNTYRLKIDCKKDKLVQEDIKKYFKAAGFSGISELPDSAYVKGGSVEQEQVPILSA